MKEKKKEEVAKGGEKIKERKRGKNNLLSRSNIGTKPMDDFLLFSPCNYHCLRMKLHEPYIFT